MDRRSAQVSRETAETRVELSVDLDGTGESRIATGIGFLDHMLVLFARHAMADLEVTAKGDLEVDFHHTTEDVGIVLGQAIARALGDKRGITRYGACHLPMDEALTRTALDISGRPMLAWRVEFPAAKVGEMDTELFREFFQALAVHAGLTLHIEKLAGENAHHIAESCFKGVARALRDAVAIDPRSGDRVPSTKGQLGG